MSLLGRLLLVVIAAIVPAVAFHAYTVKQAVEACRELARDESLRLLGLVNTEQLRIIEGAEQTLDGIGAALRVSDNRPEFCHDLLVTILQQEPRYANAGILRLDGRLMCSALPTGVGLDLSDRAYFHDVLRTGGLVVGEYMVGRVMPQAAFVIAKPLRDAHGTIAGVLEVSMSLEWLGQQLAELPMPDYAIARFADRNGVLLARRRMADGAIGRRIPATNDFSLEGDQPGIKPAYGSDGRPIILAYAPPGPERNRFAIGVAVDPETAFAGVARADRTGMTLLVAGGSLALALTALLGNQLIRRPAAELLRAAENWRAGALDFRTSLKRDRTEFGRIAAALDDMAEALQAREHAVSTALESTTDAVLVIDRTWLLTYVNRRALALTGGHDVLGQSFWEAFPQLRRTAFAERCQTTMATGVPATIETPWNDAIQYCKVMAYPAPDGLTLYIHDTTEERRIAAALRDSEARLELARDAAGIGIWENDATTRALVWSEQKYRLHGMDPAAGGVDHKTLLNTVHPEDRERVMALVSADVVPGRAYGAEFRVIWPHGEVRWLLTRAGGVFNGDGQASRLVGITMDITERKRIEEALHDSEERLRLALECAMIGAWTVTKDGQFEATPQAKVLHGLAPDTPIDHEMALAAVHPDDRAMIAARLEAAWTAGVGYEAELRAVMPDGSIRWLASRGRRIEPAGGPARLFGVVQDVTGRKQAETELRSLTETLEARVQIEVAAREAAQTRATQAERLQALGQLAGGIAHDFNNVLQTVSGALTMIDRRVGDADAVHRLTRLGTEATERGASVTRRLLSFGRLADLAVEAVDLPVLLRDLHEMLAPALGAQIAVTLTTPDDLPKVMADKRQLETVLVNLATNARDAMPEGGCLIIAADGETVSAPDHPLLKPGPYVRISVTDTGIGMDAATFARCKEPFFTTKQVGIGTGLGLPMAHSFADQSGGALEVASQPGVGTSVTLWLPRATAEFVSAGSAVGADAVHPGAPEPSKTLSILVVEDEAVIRELIGNFLSDAGYAVVLAANGPDALALIHGGQAPDALITDLTMPGMDGLALIRAVRERHPRLPAILLTGYAGDDAALALARSTDGAVSVLRKPVPVEHLLDRLGAVLATGDPGSAGMAPRPA